MATSAQYAATPRCGVAQITTANTARDGSGTIETVFTAGANGSRVDAVCIKATGTTSAGMIRLFIHDGTTSRLLTELMVQVATPGASVPAWEAALNESTSGQIFPILLPSGYSLRASTQVANTFNLFAIGGDF